jgi:hypothetical protein
MFNCLTFLIVLLTYSAAVCGQTSDLYINSSNGGLCSTSIKLFQDGKYNYESGCEASSNVSFGIWLQKKDTIKFTPIDTKEFKVLKIIPSTTQDSKLLSVKVFDQTGKNITEKIIVKQYVQRKGYFNLDLDSSKTKRTDFFRDSGIIIISSLERLNNGTLGVQVDSFTNFEITLNIPNDLIYDISPNWIEMKSFELLKTKDALLSIETYPSDGNAKPFKIEYKKSK